MFDKLKEFGYDRSMIGRPEIKNIRNEAKEAKRAQNLAEKHEKQGLPFIVECTNPKCFSALEFVYEHLYSECQALHKAGWRRFGKEIILCPNCRAIQEKRLLLQHNARMREFHRQRFEAREIKRQAKEV
jgi:hypothetical protein